MLLGTDGSARNYPDTLRRVRFVDPETNRRFIFLTNNFELPALTIAQLYKSRWRIELFFNWIKQHLRIKAFYRYSENAVKTQIWIAVASYVLIAILKKRLLLNASLHEIMRRSMKSYRYSASTSSRKRQFYGPAARFAPTKNQRYFSTN